jgi:methionyl-tRNA synthetase
VTYENSAAMHYTRCWQAKRTVKNTIMIKEKDVKQTCSKCKKEYTERSIEGRCGVCGGTGENDGDWCFQCGGDGTTTYTPKKCYDCLMEDSEGDYAMY